MAAGASLATLAVTGLVSLGCWAVAEECAGWHVPQRAGASTAPIAETLADATADKASLRVAAFNIRRAKGRDGRRDLDRVADLLRGYDLAFCSELDFETDQPARLAETLGLSLLAAPTEREGGRVDFGNAFLTRDADPVMTMPLPFVEGRGFRNLSIVRVQPFADSDVTLTILGTHLASARKAPEQLEVALELFEMLEPPVVLMGDLNARQGNERLQQTLARGDVADCSPGKKTRIDWILLRGGGEVALKDGGLIENDASDHPVVWAEFIPAEQHVSAD
ncbi:MAG: endonuclease/exonuclease/phosphatase family protein [Planctomycetota bacterium]